MWLLPSNWHEVHAATTMEFMLSCFLILLDEMFEQLHIEAFSSPPELPDVMKPQDSGSTANEQAVQWLQGEETGRRWKDGIGCVWINCSGEVLGGGYVI